MCNRNSPRGVHSLSESTCLASLCERVNSLSHFFITRISEPEVFDRTEREGTHMESGISQSVDSAEIIHILILNYLPYLLPNPQSARNKYLNIEPRVLNQYTSFLCFVAILGSISLLLIRVQP